MIDPCLFFIVVFLAALIANLLYGVLFPQIKCEDLDKPLNDGKGGSK